ncbi:MAG: glycosyltransferase [Paludibacteraceae bacterium]|nr:glycosyltransferase [Paludibacteraceae bacterium]
MKKENMRVLIVCSYKPQLPEGCVPFIREQVGSLCEQGCDCEYYHIKGKGIVGYLREVPKLRRRIGEWNPDVVHAHFGLSCLVANLATRRVPVVSTYHGSDINVKSVRRFSKIAIRLSAWNIFVSKRNVDIAKPKKHWSLIPCGVALSEDQLQSRAEARKALGWSASDKKVLFTSAFDNAVKDPELAKAAVALLEDVELIELKGYNRQQVNTIMCACDCLLMTSKTEGSPQVIKEAMACGCPIVSVDVGDVAERTVGVDGCYVVPSREPQDIAEALKKAIAFEGKTNGRKHILSAGLTNEQVAKRIIEIYEDIIGK